jgi:Ricin-type beta-trefoil lectin domain-like
MGISRPGAGTRLARGFGSRILAWGGRALALAGPAVIAAAAFPAASAASAQAAVAPVAASGTSFPAGVFSLVNYNAYEHGSYRCVGISGTAAGLWNCTYDSDQAWQQGTEYGSTGYYQLENAKDQCLGVSAGSKKEGARLVGWDCLSTHKDQYWKVNSHITEDGIEWYSVKNLNSGYVIGVQAGGYSNGAAVVQWRYQGEPNNQDWAFLADK